MDFGFTVESFYGEKQGWDESGWFEYDWSLNGSMNVASGLWY